MKPALKKTFSAILIALASLVIVIGITSLAMVQGGKRILPIKVDTRTPTLPATELASDITSTPVSDATSSSTTDSTPSSTSSTSQTCTTPKGWMPIIVMPNQTLEETAVQYKTTSEKLKEGNCLTDNNIQQATIIFVPFPTAQVSQGGAQCGAPAGWVIYYVQPGDTLYGIAAAYGISAKQLMYANCLQSSNIMVGQALYVPNVPPYFGNPGQPLPPMWTPAPTDITFPMLLTPQTPMLPTGIPFPAP